MLANELRAAASSAVAPQKYQSPPGNQRLKRLLVQFQNRIQALEPGPLVVALSGGLDSCVLLHLLATVVDRHSNPVQPCCVQHGIREKHPELESGALPQYCQNLGLELKSYRIQGGWLREQAQLRGLSLEDLARCERYRRLQHCSQMKPEGMTGNSNREAIIVLAHHADDQAENFFMNLGRGAGPSALAGIREWQSHLPVSTVRALTAPVNIAAKPAQLRLWRPLLHWSRRDLQDWAEFHNLPHWEDHSNFEPDALRNFYRWQVLPQLKRLLPNILQGVRRSQRHLALLEDWLAEQSQRLQAELYLTDGPDRPDDDPDNLDNLDNNGQIGRQIQWRGDFLTLAKPLQVELVFLMFDKLRCGEFRRRRLPFGFSIELERQWQNHCQQGRSKTFALEGHGCLWQLNREGLTVRSLKP